MPVAPAPPHHYSAAARLLHGGPAARARLCRALEPSLRSVLLLPPPPSAPPPPLPQDRSKDPWPSRMANSRRSRSTSRDEKGGSLM